MNKFYILSVAVFSALILCSCAERASSTGSAEAGTNENKFDTARAAVVAVLQGYQGYTRDSFSGLVDQGFQPSYDQFIKTMDSASSKEHALDYEVYVNQVNLRDDLMAVSFRWNKKFALRSDGVQNKKTGNSEFVFRKNGSVWLLSKIGGSNPF